jgi:hypothetical protein
MSTDFSNKPVGAPGAAPIVQPASEAADSAVATELPPTRSVTAAGSSATRQAYIHQAEASIVYQVADNRTNLVLQQFPDDAVLRRRAYFRTLALTKSEAKGRLATDRRA